MSDYLLFLGRLTKRMDKALEDEGIAPEVRQRVVNRIMLGEPAPEAESEPAPDFPATFGELEPGSVFLPMGDDSNSGPGWPLAER